MSDKIEIKKDTFYKGSIVVLAVLLIISIFTGGFGIGAGSSSSGENANVADTGGNTQQPVNMNVFLSNTDLYPSIGPKDAKAVVVEFADFQCIWCALASGLPSWATTSTTNPSAKQMISRSGPDMVGSMEKIENLAKQGKIRFVYVPVSLFGQESVYAAQAGYCALNQGKFWEMHDAIYTASGDGPAENTGKFSKANLITIAKGVSGLDNAKFSDCLNNDLTLPQTKQATSSARGFGVTGTPAVYINGKQVNPLWATMQTAINSA